MIRLTSDDEARTRELGEELAAFLAPGDVISLSGDLGAGKTAFVKGLARGLEVNGPVTSPTFNILVVHQGPLPLNHFDLYRLERAEQLEDIDFWGVLEGDGVSAIEWGDKFASELPADRLGISITLSDEGGRVLEVTADGPRSRVALDAWRDAVEAL